MNLPNEKYRQWTLDEITKAVELNRRMNAVQDVDALQRIAEELLRRCLIARDGLDVGEGP